MPAAVASDPSLAEFVAVWRRVLAWDAADGRAPLAAPHTVLAVSEDGLRRMTPCDVSDPFMVDQQLQRLLLGRHVLTEAVQPGDERFSAGGRVRSLGGGEVCLSRLGEQPAFAAADAPPTAARQLAAGEQAAPVYVVDMPFVSCGEVSDAIGRHPQSNPFETPELEPEPPQ